MRRSMDYTSPNQDHSSSKLSSPRSRDHHHHQSSTVTTTTTTSTPHHQTLGDPNLSPDPITAMSPPIQYRECLKNHAASSGGHVLDGCGEFMPASTDYGAPEALNCAACQCHRSFHRRETEGQAKETQMMMMTTMMMTPRGGNSSEAVLPSSVLLPHRYNHHHLHPHQQQRHRHQNSVMMAFGGAESSSEDLNAAYDQGGGLLVPVSSSAKKRFRTKFNNEQKEKMTEFAERIGWRIQKQDEQEVQRFCSEAGVKRQVFKVWMHNNKQAMKKKDNSNNSSNSNNDNDHNHRATT